MATATQTAQRPRLKERYDDELRASLKEELGLSSVMILAIYRFGSWVPAPGVDSQAIKDYFNRTGGTVLGLLNLFSGGALGQFALFALGIMEHGLQKVEVFVKGPGSGRETAIRSLQAAGLEILGVRDVSPQAHNGVRPKKRRRV